jgi:DNA polymerase-3 subunit epsilon
MGQHDRADISQHCTILDTLMMARERHPGQRNSLDACANATASTTPAVNCTAPARLGILADVYLAMTGGQTSLSLAGMAPMPKATGSGGSEIRRLPGAPGRVIMASEEELEAHAERLAAIAKSAGGPAMWQALTETPAG